MSDSTLFTTIVAAASASAALKTLERLVTEGVDEGHHPIDVVVWKYAATHLYRTTTGYTRDVAEFDALDELAQSHVLRAVENAIRVEAELMNSHPILVQRRAADAAE